MNPCARWIQRRSGLRNNSGKGFRTELCGCLLAKHQKAKNCAEQEKPSISHILSFQEFQKAVHLLVGGETQGYAALAACGAFQ